MEDKSLAGAIADLDQLKTLMMNQSFVTAIDELSVEVLELVDSFLVENMALLRPVLDAGHAPAVIVTAVVGWILGMGAPQCGDESVTDHVARSVLMASLVAFISGDNSDRARKTMAFWPEERR